MNEMTEQVAPITEEPPPWTKEEFPGVMRELAADEAPRLFAIVEEYGDADNVLVAGYGLVYEDRAEITSVEGGLHLTSQSAESARRLFQLRRRSSGVSQTHLVWFAPGETTSISPEDSVALAQG